MSEPFLLVALGFSVGTIGTLIGAGGGFILVPILLLLYPNLAAETVTGISLSIVFCNALSGSIAYAIKRRIDYRSAAIFSLASAPGALGGAFLVRFVPRQQFQIGFGIVMVLISIYLLLQKPQLQEPDLRQGYNMKLGIAISFFVGFASSLLGIGGGIIHVPALVTLLHFPVHIATATSHAILAVMALVGVIEHAIHGDLNSVLYQIYCLAPGVVVGAQLGAYLSPKVKGPWIMKGLALALMTVGIRFLFW